MNRFERSANLIGQVLDNLAELKKNISVFPSKQYHYYVIANPIESYDDIAFLELFINKYPNIKFREHKINIPNSVGMLLVREKIK